MSVYVVKHDVYGYEDGCNESFVEVFDSLESATNYFKIKKEQILDEYMDETGINRIQDLMNHYDFDYDFEPASFNLPYAYISLDEYGYDRLVIQKKDIMKFN